MPTDLDSTGRSTSFGGRKSEVSSNLSFDFSRSNQTMGSAMTSLSIIEDRPPSPNGESLDGKEKFKQSLPSNSATATFTGMTWEDWKKLPLQFAKVYIIIFCLWLGLLSVYWGSLFHREDRVRNMKVLVAIEDSSFLLSNSTLANAIVGPYFEDLLGEHTDLADYIIANITELEKTASEANKSIIQVLETEVNEQRYWAAFHVDVNTSAWVYDLMLSGNTLSSSASSLDLAITVVYESGRHFSALSQYVTKNIRTLGLFWTNINAPLAYGEMIKSYLSSQQQQTMIENINPFASGSFISYLPTFNLKDLRPAMSSAVLGPSELGLIYAQMFSFHQFNFSADLHNSVRENLHFRDFLLYRILFSQVNHIVLALVYGLMTLAFQVPIDVAYGKSGFLVLWGTVYLFMSASGGLNEFVGTLISFYDMKHLLPPWVIVTIVFNIAPTFAPFVLSPGFYRYGYAVPMFNAYEALKVVFFDTWKGTLGRNYGVLIAWVILTNIALCFSLKFISKRSGQSHLRDKKR